MKKSHKKVKIDEVLFYSGARPKTLKDKPEGRLLARVPTGGKMVRPLEAGGADYCIYVANKTPVGFVSIGHAKGCGVDLECGSLPETEPSKIGYDELASHV
jgi:hypothetical protein